MSCKVLLVDDDPIINLVQSKVIKSVFPSSDLKVFAHAKEVLTYLKANQEHTYLILLDINMPEMNAWDFLSAIEHSDIQYHLDVIIVSSSIDQSDKEKAADFKRVKGFISKPLTKEHIRGLSSYFLKE